MRHFILLFFIITLCNSCKKDQNNAVPTTQPPNYWGEASAEKNGLSWEANPVCKTDIIDSNTINIQLDSFVNGFFLKESLTFHAVPRAAGSYDVFKLSEPYDGKTAAYLFYWEDDVPLGIYHLIEGDTINHLVLESFDSNTKELKGNFELTFLVEHRPYPTAPDTIRFTNGRFHGRLYK